MNKKILSAATSILMLLNMAAPAFAAQTFVVTGNGADSDNDVQFEVNHTTDVVQSNTTQIDNDIEVESSTGENEANKNTTGDVNVKTGDSVSSVKVVNDVNSNTAEVDECCTGDTTVKISGNGADSENDVKLQQANDTIVAQLNDADIDNDVDVESSTGENEANKNTGGDIKVTAGSAIADVVVKNLGNENVAVVGGDSEGSALSAYIVENGADSENEIELDLAHVLDVIQDNTADVDNDVDADAETGENEAEANTGGSVTVKSGSALAGIMLDNELGFNAGEFGCGCLIEDIMAKVNANGADSENEIKAALADESSFFQTNDSDLDNDLDADAETGENEAEANTGEADGDPSVTSGTAINDVVVHNKGSENVIGEVDHSVFEIDGQQIGFSFTFDMDSFLDYLGLN